MYVGVYKYVAQYGGIWAGGGHFKFSLIFPQSLSSLLFLVINHTHTHFKQIKLAS